LAEMTKATECGLLLDVNNVYVSSVNHDFDPEIYLKHIPFDRVVQCHLAGHTNCGTHLIDTHDGEVIDPVWQLYREVHRQTGGISTLLEWDAQIPPFEKVHAEVLKAKDHMAEQLPKGDAAIESGPVDQTAAVPHPLHFVTPEVQ
jgi:uncharacterized protein (UPF0276 family)